MKRQPSEREKIIPNEATGKELIFKMDKQLIQFNIRKTNNATKEKKKARRPKATFLQRRHIDGQQTKEKMLQITHYYRNAY